MRAAATGFAIFQIFYFFALHFPLPNARAQALMRRWWRVRLSFKQISKSPAILGARRRKQKRAQRRKNPLLTMKCNTLLMASRRRHRRRHRLATIDGRIKCNHIFLQCHLGYAMLCCAMRCDAMRCYAVLQIKTTAVCLLAAATVSRARQPQLAANKVAAVTMKS